jgi:hypothetical protein
MSELSNRLPVVCAGCGVEANAACNCGVAYAPKVVRAAEAIKANPQKSDRAIAEELGINQSTVSRVRQRGDADASPAEHVGRDGKSYSIRQRITEDPDIPPKLAEEAA